MGEQGQSPVNNSIAWIIAYKNHQFTDAIFEEFSKNFIENIPHELGRLNAKSINEAVRALSDEVIIALRKSLCNHLLSKSLTQDKTKFILKKKNQRFESS